MRGICVETRGSSCGKGSDLYLQMSLEQATQCNAVAHTYHILWM